jgi:hypothetical protein
MNFTAGYKAGGAVIARVSGLTSDRLEDEILTGTFPTERIAHLVGRSLGGEWRITVLIVVRGRRRWEVILGVLDTKVASAFIDDFACAGEAVLGWAAPMLPISCAAWKTI